jgi:hypothetical protein
MNTDLRLTDLVAKTARVNLKNALSTMRAVREVARHLGIRESEVLQAALRDTAYTMPSEQNAKACYEEFRQMAGR